MMPDDLEQHSHNRQEKMMQSFEKRWNGAMGSSRFEFQCTQKGNENFTLKKQLPITLLKKTSHLKI